MTATLIDMAGHASFGLTAISFYVRDMIVLRGLAIIAGLVGIIYNYGVAAGPLWLVIFWLSVFIAINAVRIAGLFLERRAVKFSEEETELFETVFQNFSPVEFMKLMRIGQWRSAEKGEYLAEQGHDIGDLKLLYNGEVVVDRDGAEIGRAKDGAMIGEISFIQGGGATATVTVERPSRYIAWPETDLRKLLHRNPAMDVAMKHVFSIDLMRKLAT
jgi:hypothetical protein